MIADPKPYNYLPPLKQDLDCLKYDMHLICSQILSLLPTNLPEYLSRLEKRIVYFGYSKPLQPKPFPTGNRVYILDNRLNIVFLALDDKGELSTYFSKLAAYCKDISDNVYGDGYITKSKFCIGDYYNPKTMKRFRNTYGFLPMEDFARPSIYIFNGENMVDTRFISQYSMALLLLKFQRKNIIQWQNIYPPQSDFL